MLERIRLALMMIGFLALAPVIGVVAALSHDARYEDDLSDEW